MNRRTKRKIKKIYRNNSKAIVFLTFFVVILFMTVGYGYLSTELNAEGKGTILSESSVCSAEVTTVVEKFYGKQHYQTAITIRNTGSVDLDGWEIKLDATNTKPTTTEVNFREEGTSTYISNMEANGYIKRGDSITFSIKFQTKEDINQALNSITMVTCYEALGDQQASAEKSSSTITSGGATLVIGESEKPIRARVTLQEAGALDGTANIYSVSFTNNTSENITGIRGIIYYGNNAYISNTNLDVSNDTTNHSLAIRTPSNDSLLEPNESTTQNYTITISTTDRNYIPDIVAVGNTL